MAWAIGTPVNISHLAPVVTGFSLPCSFTVAAGDLIRVFVTYDISTGATSTTAKDNLFAAAYTLTEHISDTGNNQALDILYFIATGAGTITSIDIKFNPTPGTTTSQAISISGVKITGSDAASVFDGGDARKFVAPGTGANAAATNNFTTTVNGDLLFTAIVDSSTGNDVFTLGTGWTLLDTTGFVVAKIAYRIQASAASTAGLWTVSAGGDTYIIVADSITPASGGATVTPRKTIKDVSSFYEEEQNYYYRNALLFKPHGGAAGPPVPFKQGKTFQVLNYFEPDFFDYTRAVVQSGKRPGIIPGFPRKTFQNNNQATFDGVVEQDFSNYYGGKLSVPRIAATAGFPRRVFQNQSAIAFQEIDALNSDSYYGVKISKPSHGGSGATPRKTFQNISQACFDLSPETYDQYYGVKVAKPHIGPPPGPTTGVINKFGYVGNGDRVG